jgi:hypothetical protein
MFIVEPAKEKIMNDELGSENEQQLRDDEWQNQTPTPGDIFSPATDEERLDEDNDTPSAPADYPEDGRMPLDHPNTDTDIDAGGQYFGGTAEEAGYNPEPEDTDDTVGPADLNHQGR